MFWRSQRSKRTMARCNYVILSITFYFHSFFLVRSLSPIFPSLFSFQFGYSRRCRGGCCCFFSTFFFIIFFFQFVGGFSVDAFESEYKIMAAKTRWRKSSVRHFWKTVFTVVNSQIEWRSFAFCCCQCHCCCRLASFCCISIRVTNSLHPTMKHEDNASTVNWIFVFASDPVRDFPLSLSLLSVDEPTKEWVRMSEEKWFARWRWNNEMAMSWCGDGDVGLDFLTNYLFLLLSQAVYSRETHFWAVTSSNSFCFGWVFFFFFFLFHQSDVFFKWKVLKFFLRLETRNCFEPLTVYFNDFDFHFSAFSWFVVGE